MLSYKDYQKTKPKWFGSSNFVVIAFCFSAEHHQHAAQWWSAEDFSRKSGQQGLHQVRHRTEASKQETGEAGQHLQGLRRDAG